MDARRLGGNLLVCTFVLCGMLHAQPDTTQVTLPFTFQASYVGDLINNVRGGITTGSCYLGMANLTIGFDTKAAGLWSGGAIFIKGASTHGATPSASMIGDFQVMSNLEAGDHTYIQEFWYKQTLGPVSVTVGLQDLNATFAANEFSGMYLNSSFGIHPTLSSNVPVSIFPLTSPGATVTWEVSERVSLLACVYDANPVDFAENPYNIKWRFTAGDGIIAAAEAQVSTGAGAHARGVYKIGVYNHDHLSAVDPETNLTETVYENNYGVYATIDQSVIGKPSEPGSVAAFARGSACKKQFNENYFFAGAGVNYYGLLKPDGSDVLGLAVARVSLSSTDDETAFELTYQSPVTENITLQPDVQYIVHPAGTGAVLPNALAGTLRLLIHF